MIPTLQLGQIGRSIMADASTYDDFGAIQTIAYAFLATDINTTSTTFSTIASTSLTVSGTSDLVEIIGSFSFDTDPVSAGNSPTLQITVDGTDVGQSFATAADPGVAGATFRIVQVTGLSAGAHTIALKWKSSGAGNNVRIRVATDPLSYHAGIVARIANASVYSAFSGSTSSTAATATDTLISGVSFTSTAANSALYIRFSACGQSTAAGSAPRFQVIVDGVAQDAGCGDMGDGAGFRFNAGLVCVIPVTSGAHTVDIKWGGQATGSSINTATAQHHACVLIDEVYTSTDPGSTFARPKYSHLASDVGDVSNSVLATATFNLAATTLIFVETTTSNGHTFASGGSGRARIKVDGTAAIGAHYGAVNNAGRGSMAIPHVVSLAAGSHTIDLVGTDGIFDVVTNNQSEHAALLVWAVTT